MQIVVIDDVFRYIACFAVPDMHPDRNDSKIWAEYTMYTELKVLVFVCIHNRFRFIFTNHLIGRHHTAIHITQPKTF